MNILKLFKQKSLPIGILDGGFEGIDIFNTLCKRFSNQSFIYINDLKHYPYEEKSENDIRDFVKENVEVLLSYNVSKIIVVNNSIIEYCEDYLKDLSVPVIKINDIIIDYLNDNYEHKNILFLAKQYIIKANIYQKNLKYNHLYNVESDELEEIVLNKQTKTAKSFEKVREVLSSVHNREYNVLVYVDSYLNNLRIEFNEYNTGGDILNLSDIIAEVLDSEIDNKKRNPGNLILSKIERNDFVKTAYWIDCKYKYIKIGE